MFQQRLIETFIPQLAVEAFIEAILLEFAWRDESAIDTRLLKPFQDVRRQVFWHQEQLKLRVSLAHLVDCIMRRVDGDASVALRVSF
jgi:hypothetical protein